MGDIYVNDAFSCSHRSHASVEGITKYIPSYFGLQITEEINALKKITSEIKKPVSLIIGGSKISTKIKIINNLIKKFKPKFNILLKDDKSFPFIFIGNKDHWPQVTKHRGKKEKDGFYFGPFASAGSANWTIKMLQKIFLLRVCDDTTFKNRKRPCILYQIKRCSAPCVS